jgi:phage tail-like protein
MTVYYPPVGFHFRVTVLGLPKSSDFDVRFTEVGGLSVELATEEVIEGGENRFIQKYPTRAKYPELVLKRGLLLNSPVREWARDCIENLKIQPKNVDVDLLNEAHQPLMTWHLAGAYPTRWSVSDLNASSNAVVIETMQLYYQYFTVHKS